MRHVSALLGALVLTSALAACSSSKSTSGTESGSTVAPITIAPSAAAPEPYPAPSNPMVLAKKAGLVPEDAEQLQYHVHAHLDVFINGTHIRIPAGLGIDITNPRVHSGAVDGATGYGGIVVACAQPCISPLHTHDITGVLHTESSTHKDNTLGQLFIEWNVKFDANCFATYCKPATSVAVYVNGKLFSGDPRTIPLANLTEIAVVVGTPPGQIPNSFDQNLI